MVAVQGAGPMSFAEMLRGLRDGRGMTQDELAAKSGVPVSTIRNYEQGQRLPTFAGAAKLAAALGVSLDELAKCDDVLADAPPEPPRSQGKRK
jgi:transcriptional regulator with XRE-family HTH domain